ncbi:BT_3928 family protein [Ferruginibacter sp. SUN002]|uniref:BT_3928 family protein n=1 Tax=Ferruginibacter sp. SUN002 TaxID=2937789 RepID=UPI003D360BD6
MKFLVNIARILVGGLFIFSGLVKAIDPLGLSYKMEEFFEVWAAEKYLPSLMNWFHGHSYLFSVIMITLEVAVGVALLVGWKKKWSLSILLLLIVFFTFLTSYVLFSGKIRACGCFGDCIPLTPIQTFSKDIILLLLVILLLVKQKYINPIFKDPIPLILVSLATVGTIFLQVYVVKHLPLKDCLPFKVGNDILKLRKMPEGAIPDKYDFVFTYKKGTEKKDFTMNNLPDSTWEYVDRKQVLIQKGKNNIPLINDFTFTTTNSVFTYEKDGNAAEYSMNEIPDSSWTFVERKEVSADSTEAILGQPGEYYILYVRDISKFPSGWETDHTLINNVLTKGKRIYVVTADRKKAEDRYNLKDKKEKANVSVFSCDATALKTVSRNNITLYLMKGPIVQNKWGGEDIIKALDK